MHTHTLFQKSRSVLPVSPSVTRCIGSIHTMVLQVSKPTTFTMKIRVPSWAAGKVSISVNGKAVDATPGTFADVTRTWSSGDTVEVFYEMTLWASAIEDDRPVFYNSTFACVNCHHDYVACVARIRCLRGGLCVPFSHQPL